MVVRNPLSLVSLRNMSYGTTRTLKRRPSPVRGAAPARKDANAIGIHRSDLLVPAPQYQERQIMPDDRLDWREVRDGDRGKTVAVMVAEVTDYDVKIVHSLIGRKEVLIQVADGKLFAPPANYVLKQGDMLAIPKVLPNHLWKRVEGKTVPERKLSPEEIRLVRSWVLFKNDACIVINKPQGVPATPTYGGGLSVHDLLGGLKYSQSDNPKIVSRLETEASGCMVIARSEEALQFLKRHLIQPRIPSFCYWGIIGKKPKQERGRIKMNTELHRSAAGDRVLVRMTPTSKSQKVTVEYQTVSESKHGPCWVAMYPISNIRHQLRIATSVAMKTPVLGDVLYGGDGALPYKQLSRILGNFENRLPLMLHCSQVSLPFESATHERTVVTASVPESMKSIFQFMMWNHKHKDPYLSGIAENEKW